MIVLVHGNHGSCDSGSAPNCTAFKRNDRGYAYLGENLASWGYTVASIDQDQLMYYQDGNCGGHAPAPHDHRRDARRALRREQPAAIPDGANTNIGGALVGKLDLTRIGLMGHSRGGDAVSSFIDYNRDAPAPGRRYTLRGVIALAPVDYERRAPYGMPYLTILPLLRRRRLQPAGRAHLRAQPVHRPGRPVPAHPDVAARRQPQLVQHGLVRRRSDDADAAPTPPARTSASRTTSASAAARIHASTTARLAATRR